MLRADGGYDPDGRVDDVAYLLNIAGIARAHLADEDLVRRAHALAYRPDDAEGGVVAVGGGEHAEALGEHGGEYHLHARLAVASRHADDAQRGHPGEALFRVVYIMTVYELLQGRIYRVSQQHEIGRGERDESAEHHDVGPVALVEVSEDEHREADYRERREKALYTRRRDEGLFRLFREIEKAYDEVYRRGYEHADAAPLQQGRDRQRCPHRPDEDVEYVFRHPFALDVGLIGIELEHVHRAVQEHRHAEQPAYREHAEADIVRHFPTSRKLSSTRPKSSGASRKE